jgi:hypothetical protein
MDVRVGEIEPGREIWSRHRGHSYEYEYDLKTSKGDAFWLSKASRPPRWNVFSLVCRATD